MNSARHAWARALARTHLPNIGSEARRSGPRPGQPRSHAGEFEQVDVWKDGDDIRYVDWSATARTGELHVRRASGARPRDVLIWVDESPGMWLGTQVSKRSTAGALSDALAFVARRDGHRASWVDHASGGRCTSWQPSPEPTAPLVPAEVPAGCLLVLVSDFRPAHVWEGTLALLPESVGVIAVEVRDRTEMDPPRVGRVLLRDPQSGSTRLVDTSRESWREEFSQLTRADRARIERAFTDRSALYVVVGNDQDALVTLARALEAA